MRKLVLMVASTIALAGFAAPASAHPYDDAHYDEHERLNDQHDAIHDDLDQEHVEAHEEGMTPWEHRQLHRYLDQKHDWEDEQLRRKHRRWHNRNDWEDDGYGRYDGYSRYYPRSYGRSSSVYFNFGW